MTAIIERPEFERLEALHRDALEEALRKHPQPLSLADRMHTITEEYLEAVKAYNDGDLHHCGKELGHIKVTIDRALLTIRGEACPALDVAREGRV